MPEFSPTEEQLTILKAACDSDKSVMVRAYAGCAKTTMLKMIAQDLPPEPALAIVFNVKNKDDLVKFMPPHIQVKTMNGLGHSAWAKTIGRQPKVDDGKFGKILKQVMKEEGNVRLSGDQWSSIKRLVAAAMHGGLVPDKYPQYKGLIPDTQQDWSDLADSLFIQPEPIVLDFARAVLIEDIKQGFSGVINYDDQIYLSSMFNGVFPRFGLVLVDEAQDLSPLNHIQVKRCAAGRLIVVGDPKQAIYAFRGADSSSMDNLRKLRPDDNWIDLPLATTFRCPKIVVGRQQDHAPGFRAHHTNKTGAFIRLGMGKEDEENSWGWDTIQDLSPTVDATVAMLCRNNAPAIAMAFKLIRKGIGCHMLGRDIGKGLVALSKTIIPKDATPATECARLITEWQDHQEALARANEKEEKISGITDRAESLLAVLEVFGAKDAEELCSALEMLFSKETGKVTLSTGHRAKGLEWDVVVILDPWRIPSKFAKKAADAGYPAQMEQEMNLQYVMETRAKQILIHANAEDFE